MIVVPTGPELGVSVSVAVVPVNVAVAVSPVDPVAVTMFGVPLLLKEKLSEVLAVKVQPENDPELTEHVAGEVVRAAVDVPAVNATDVSPEAKPLPDAVTVVPAGPLVGLSVSVGGAGSMTATVNAHSEVEKVAADV